MTTKIISSYLYGFFQLSGAYSALTITATGTIHGVNNSYPTLGIAFAAQTYNAGLVSGWTPASFQRDSNGGLGASIAGGA